MKMIQNTKVKKRKEENSKDVNRLSTELGKGIHRAFKLYNCIQ